MAKLKKKEIKFLSLTIDAIFKAFFTRNKACLISFLQSVLPLPPGVVIVDAMILNPEIFSQDPLKKKDFKLDLKLVLKFKPIDGKTPDEKIANVEMQTAPHKHFIGRTLAYICRIFSDQLDKGDSYGNLSQVYSVVITTNNLKELKGCKDYYHVFNIRRTEKPYVVMSEDLVFVIIELGKFMKDLKDIIDIREYWCYLLKHSGHFSQEAYNVFKRKGGDMADAVEKLWTLSQDELLREYKMAEDRQRRDQLSRDETMYEEGMEEGIEKGILKGQEEIALNLLRKGLDMKLISECTNLSEEAIKALKKKLSSS